MWFFFWLIVLVLKKNVYFSNFFCIGFSNFFWFRLSVCFFRKKPIFLKSYSLFYYFYQMLQLKRFLEICVSLVNSSSKSWSASSAFWAVEAGQDGRWFLPGLAQPGSTFSTCMSGSAIPVRNMSHSYAGRLYQHSFPVAFLAFLVLLSCFLPIFWMPKQNLLSF